MKVKSKQEFTLTINKDELNAILLALSRMASRKEEWSDNKIEFYGYGGIRQTHVTTFDELIQQLERL